MAEIRINERIQQLHDEAATAASQTAPTNSPEFVRAFTEHFVTRAFAPEVAARKLSQPIYQDERYIANALRMLQGPKHDWIISRVLGKETNTYPECVAVTCTDGSLCTGTVVAPRAVLTAAHCDCANAIVAGSDLANPTQRIAVETRIPHPYYDPGTNKCDFMILVLAEDVLGVPQVTLASTAMIDAAFAVRVVGFGAADFYGSAGAGIKRVADVPVVSQSCSGMRDGEPDTVAYGCFSPDEIVAANPLPIASPDDTDTCVGDSGGPCYIVDPGALEDRVFLAAVTSRATKTAVARCGDGGVYPRIDRCWDWLTTIPQVSMHCCPWSA